MVLILNKDNLTNVMDVSALNVYRTPKGRILIDYIWGTEHVVMQYTGSTCSTTGKVAQMLAEYHTLDEFEFISNMPVSMANLTEFDQMLDKVEE